MSRDRAMIVRHGMWSLAGKVTNLAVAFLNTALVARLLTPVEFADLNALRTLMMLLAIGLAGGLAQMSLRRLGQLSPAERASTLPHRIVRNAFCLFAAASLLVVGIAVMLLWKGAGWFVHGQLPPFQIAIASAGILLIGASELIAEFHRGLGVPGTANFLGGTRGAPATTLLFVVLLSAASFVAPVDFLTANTLFVVATLLICGVGYRSLYRKLAQRDDNVVWEREWPRPAFSGHRFAEALPLSLALMMSFAVLQGDLLLAARLPTAEESAAYVGARRCIQLISIPLMVLNTLASGIITPLITSNRRELLEKTLRGCCGVAAVPALAMAVCFAAAPELSLRIILGEGYSPGSTALRILVIGQVLYVLTGSCGTVLTLTGCRRTVLVTNLVALLTLASGGPFVASRFGAVGLATLVSGILAANNLMNWYLARRLTGINTWFSFRDMLQLRGLLSSAGNQSPRVPDARTSHAAR